MKLHLPKGLRSAVLACMTVVGGFATTIATGHAAEATYTLSYTITGVPNSASRTVIFTLNEGYAIAVQDASNTNSYMGLSSGDVDDPGRTDRGETAGRSVEDGVIYFTPDANGTSGKVYDWITKSLNTSGTVDRSVGGLKKSGGNAAVTISYDGTSSEIAVDYKGTDSAANAVVQMTGKQFDYSKFAVSSGVTLANTALTITGGELSTKSWIESYTVGTGSTLNIDTSFTLGSAIANSGTVHFAESGYVVTISSGITGITNGNVTSYTIVDGGTITGLSDASTDAALKTLFDIDGVVDSATKWSYANGVLSVETTSESLTWDAAGSTENVWKDGDAFNWGSGKTFDNGDFVTFSGTGEQITLEGDVIASTVSVVGTGWEFSGAGSLTVGGTFTVGDGTTDTHLTISNTGSKTFSDGVCVATGSTLKLTDTTGWSGDIYGDGTLELAEEGETYTTSSGILNTLLREVYSKTDDGNLGTLKLSNGAILSHEYGGGENWRWINSVSTFDVQDGSTLRFGVNFDYDWDESGDMVIRIAGDGDAAGEDWRKSALAFTSSVTTTLGAMELSEHATVYVVDSGTANLPDGFTTNGKTLTKTGGGTLKLTGAVSGDLYLNIDGGTLWADSSTLKKVEGSGIYVKMGSGEITVNEASSVDWSSFTGGLGVNNGTLNLSETRQLTALVFDGTSGTSATINVKAGASITAERYMSNRVTSTLNIESGSALTVTGGENSAWGGNDFVFKSTLLVNHWETPSTINIDGNFNMLNNAHFSAVDRAASEVVVNVNNGGVMNVKGITIVDRDSRDNCGATLNLKRGSQLNIGQSGISKYSIKGVDLSQTTREQLILNIEAGATLGILDGVEKWSTERALTWTGDVTVNTQGYKVAENGIGGTREGGSAGTIELGSVKGIDGATTGAGVIKEGVGTLILGAETTLTKLAVNAGSVEFAGQSTVATLTVNAGSVEFAGQATVSTLTVNAGSVEFAGQATVSTLTVNAGSVSFAGAADVTTLSMAANTGLNIDTSGDVKVGTFDKSNLGTMNVMVTGVIDKVGSYTLMTGDGATGFSITDAERVLLADLANGLEFESLTDGVLTIKAGTAAPVGALTWQTSDADNVWRDTPIYKTWLLDGDAAKEQRWTNGSAATFAGTGEAVAIEGPVSAESVVVTGSGWEWTGDGSVAVTETLTVGDAQGTATDLTISNTGDRTFTGGVTVNSNAVLTVKDLDGWTGVVSGEGTLKLSLGSVVTLSADNNLVTGMIGTAEGTLNKVVIDGNTTFNYGNGYEEEINAWLNAITELEIKTGSAYVSNGGQWLDNSHVTLKLAGNGGNAANAAFANDFYGQTFGNLILTDDATIYVKWKRDDLDLNFSDSYTSNGKTLTKTGNGGINVNGLSTLADGSCFDVQAGLIVLNGGAEITGTLTKKGTADLVMGGTMSLDGDVTVEVQEGSLVLKGSVVSENTLSKTGVGALVLGDADNTPEFAAGLACIDVQEGMLKLNLGSTAYTGKIAMGDGTTLHHQAGNANLAGGVSFDGAVSITASVPHGLKFTSNIEGDADTVVSPAYEKPSDGTLLQKVYVSAASDYAGTWELNGSTDLYAAHTDAFKNATIKLSSDASLVMGVDAGGTVKVGALSGEDGSVAATTINTYTVEVGAKLGTGESSAFGGTISYGISLVMNGEGEQILSGFANKGKDITVNKGTLTLGGGAVTTDGRVVTIAPGGTLKTALNVNGGTLALDLTSDKVASLGSSALTLNKNSLATLNLTLAADVQAGDTFTLLQDVTATVDANATVGDYFANVGVTVEDTSSLSSLAEGESLRPDLTADRLKESTLFVEDGKLKLTLAAASLTSTPLYWDPADKSATGAWSGSNWSASKESMGVDPGAMADGWSGSVVFTNQEGETDSVGTVTVDTAATVSDLTVESGDYTFGQGTGGSLTVEGKLSVATDSKASFGFDIAARQVEVSGSLAAKDIKLGKLGTDGELSAGALVANAGSTLSISGVSGKGTVTISGAEVDGALSGSADVTVAVNGAEIASGKKLELSHATVGGLIEATGTLEFGGSMHVDAAKFTAVDESRYAETAADTDLGTLDGNGFIIENKKYNIVDYDGSGASTEATGTTWTVGDEKKIGEYDAATGVVSVNENKDLSAYWINTSDVVLSDISDKFVEETDTIKLNGGGLSMDENTDKLIETNEESPLSTASSIALSGSGTTLKAEQLSISTGTTVTLSGTADTVLDLGSATEAPTGLQGLDAAAWTGTVKTAATAVTDLSALGNETSTVDLTGDVVTTALSTGTVGTVKAKSLTADTLSAGASTLSVAGATTLKKGASTVGDATFTGGLTLGSGTAATLTAGELSLSKLTVGHADSTLTATALSNDTLDIRLTDGVTDNLSVGDRRTLVTLTADDSLATLSLNGEADCTMGEYASKYHYTIRWEEAAVVLTSTRNENYVKEKIEATTPNGEAGADIIQEMYNSLDPQANRVEYADLAKIMDAVDAGAVTDETAAAIAGSSISALGMALSGDVERQLRAIRNRTTSMGVNECVVNEGMPYFNAWFNAEGNRGKLSDDGTAPGYTLDSWGGTVGFDVDVNPNLSMGLAITAMYGDFTAEGPDALEGDMDTYYLSLFARYADCAWTHTFVATVGMMDGSVERTVPGLYGTDASIDGTTFGLMYEVGYVIPLDEDGEACVQPIFNVMLRHASVGSITEDGSDAGLEVGKQSMTTLTFGLGARLQAVVGESLYNRASIFEARVLAKADVGDRRSEADVSFMRGLGHKATVESAELGAIGLEVGAGLTIPLGDDDGSIFFDASLELRSGYTNVNGTVGYRINF